MKKDTELWLQYADDNFKSARVLLESGLYNPCLQNVQQAVEKYLKAFLVEQATGLSKTHSISELAARVRGAGVVLAITEDETDLLDSIYLPSKYPLASVLPHFMPDRNICQQCLKIAEQVRCNLKVVLDLP
ncbi:MAG: HEPN domain-containing protein [Trichlorobacter sp.]|uniref:HEPN domain-containing protein n=1 Tax=Trichlorobacter sp. TaxID=2911007 RepID=UPI002567C74A|nr:HEPN domain-containing protein [Trichlorobacter sp.]MDK9718813.1 HEPN domain-containing protein [Trichlorobacter sp.]